MSARRHRTGPLLKVTLIVFAGTLGSCAAQEPTVASSRQAAMGVEVLRVLEHDPNAFTQGLEIDGTDLLESTGRSGESWVRATDLATGTLRAHAELPSPLFGEGITAVGEQVWQLTWRDGIAVVRDRVTLAEKRQVPLDGEGWGICALPHALVTSDGSATLTFRDPETFDPRRTLAVEPDTAPGTDTPLRLNELECADDGMIYANDWPTDTLVRINPADGTVTAEIDAGGLRASLPDGPRDIDVLNGIAQIPGTDRFLLTGKYWPRMFEVRFVR
ncbi:MAG: glutaminyl-peptide cyclotransferase [Rhodococcus sp. (in: high G+C Gram-positive bacteria)]|uniref:glutaminyl-peptide cyclotransferase n=1 Tax=Rhodococcus sp. TaxID=1831 RepID=UPI003BB1D8C3